MYLIVTKMLNKSQKNDHILSSTSSCDFKFRAHNQSRNASGATCHVAVSSYLVLVFFLTFFYLNLDLINLGIFNFIHLTS